jgi:polygalacturonase
MTKYCVLFLFLSVLLKNGICYPSLPSEPKLPSTTCSSHAAEMSSSSLDESKPDTSRIQAAISNCSSGQAVKLTASGSNNAFISGPLTLKSGVTLWIDKGVTLYASKNPKDFDKSSGACGVVSDHDTGCHALITATSTTGSGVVGEGVIDGRGGATLTGKSVSWWDLGTEAKDSGKSQNNPRLIQIDGGKNFLLYKISLHNAPKFHVVPSDIDGFIAWSVKIQTPTSAYSKWSSDTTKNTDGIDPAGSENVVIAHSSISTGDDNVAIKGGSKASKNIIIAHNHFYKGHGMSIGSETNSGVTNVLVTDLTLDGTDNGIRIKSDASRGGKVETIRYENICMKSVDNPLVFDAYYSSDSGSLIPDFQKIEVSGVHITSSGKHQSVFRGYSSSYPLKITLDNVQSDVTIDKTTISNADITEGPGEVKGVTLTGAKISGTTSSKSAISCSFPSFGS